MIDRLVMCKKKIEKRKKGERERERERE